MESYTRLEIIQTLNKLPLSFFTTADFARLFPTDKKNTLYGRIKRLKSAKLIEELTKGKYLIVSSRPNEFTLANFLYQPSYISLESALSFYGIITGFPYRITSVTPRKSKFIRTDDREYKYFHIKPGLFWGSEKKEDFLIASREKALIDFLYYTYKGLKSLTTDELDLSEIDKRKFSKYCWRIKNTRLINFIRKLELLKL